MTTIFKKFCCLSAVLGLALSIVTLAIRAAAQDQYQQDQYQGDRQDDPPGRVARLGYMEGSVSFEPAGEQDWVQAVANRPMTIGDKLWADRDSRAELQLGSAVIRLNANTGFSFLNLDDNTIQIQLTAGAINVRVRELDRNNVFEVDTPNLAFSILQPGSYRVEASEDGNYTVVSVREGGGESTGNGQTYTLHAGQRATFSGTDSLRAEVTEIGGSDQFDTWAYNRDHRYDRSRSAQYLSRDVVGYEDLDDYGDWRDDSSYGHVWYPSHVSSGWAPYREGHWVWISPWGYTWVDDSPWGYAPFHYGRWVDVSGRWGWIPGPIEVRPVYAPALVVFIGGGGGFGGNVGWFPLGPREVYVPSYRVSREYVNRVNVSNTVVNNTTITNVYNTTIVNKTTNVTNVTYVNRNVQGAVTAVPQRAFATAQPVNRVAVAVNQRDVAAASVTTRVAVAPTRESVLGLRAATAGRVTAPPAAVVNRQVIAKTTPPPPPVSFARQQQALEAHPGQPLARSEVRAMRPAGGEAAHPLVRQAPPGRPATATVVNSGNRPGNQPENQPTANRPGQPASTPPANQQANRPFNQGPQDRPGAANPQQNRPSFTEPNQPTASRPNDRPGNNRPAAETNQPNDRPEANRPTPSPARNDRPASAQPNNRPDVNQPGNRSNVSQPDNRPQASTPASSGNDRPNRQNDQPQAERPQNNRPAEAPARNDRPADRPTSDRPANERPAAAQPNNRSEPNRPEVNRPERPEPNRPDPTRSEPNRAEQNRNQPPPRAEQNPPNDRPQQRTAPAEARPEPPQHQQARPATPEERKQEEDRRKREQQQPPNH